MKILVVGLNYWPEQIGIGPYTAGLAEYLAARGHDITIIAGNPYYPDWKLADGFDDHASDLKEGGVRVVRVPHYIPARPSGFRRIAHHLSFAKNACREIRRLGNVDCILAIAPALLAAPVALFAARNTQSVRWLHIQDFEVEAALATGLLAGPALAKAGLAVERAIISRFDWVSAISAPMVRKACEKGARDSHAIELRNWSEQGLAIDPAAGAALRAELRIPAGTLALYSGNLSLKQGSGLIADAAQILANRKDLQFVVCGTGSARAYLEDAATRLSNLHVRDLQPRDRLGALLSMADIHMLTQIDGAADLVLPSKLANMLASGRPIVATARAGTGLAAEVDGCGIITQPGDPADFAAGIMTLADDSCLRVHLGEAGMARAAERWSAAILLEKFALALENAVRLRKAA